MAIVRQIRLRAEAADGFVTGRAVSSNTLALSKDPALCHLVATYRYLLERPSSNLPAATSPATHESRLTTPSDRARARTRAAELAERAAILSRNLYFRGAVPRRDEIEAEGRTLQSNRAWIRDRLAFNGRNVMVIANGQTYATRFASAPAQASQWTRQSGGDAFYFGKSSLTNLGARLAGATGRFSFYRPDERDPEAAARLKPRVLEAMAAATNQVYGEFIGLLGHAVDGRFLLQGETIQDNDVSACISSTELAEALKRSFAGASVDPTTGSRWKIVVLAACHSQEYLRLVHERLHQTPGLAVFVADTEYGQMDYWNPTPLGSQFLDALLGSGEILSLGRLMDQEPGLRWGNPSVFLRTQDAHGRWLLQQVL